MNVANIDNISSALYRKIEQEPNRFPALKDIREAALKEFQRLGLPGNKSEEYRHTPVTRLLEKSFDFEKDQVEKVPVTDIDVTACFVPQLDAINIVFVNGIYSQELSYTGELKGIIIRKLEDVAAENAGKLTTYFSKLADVKQDPFTAWNTAAWTGGIFIQVADNTIVEKPVAIYNITNSSSGAPVLNILRNFVVVGKNSDVTIIQKNSSTGSAAHFCNIVTEVVEEENSGLNLYILQNDNNQPIEFNHITIHQANNSRVNCFTFTLAGKLIRNNLQLVLNGEGCDSHMYGLYLLDNETIADNHTIADHQKPNSFSNELYKGVMNGNSHGVFNGKIYVRPNAQKTNAFQTNRNIILTDKATVNTKPQLEIWADDVKCSHGCTSGQLDEEALFYLRARGVDKDVAQAMLLYAFAGEVLDHVKEPAIKSYLDLAISMRLNKTF